MQVIYYKKNPSQNKLERVFNQLSKSIMLQLQME
jgi:hypothetical protein